MEISLRWMRKADADAVKAIQIMADPLSPEDFLDNEINKSNSICMVAETGGKVVGYVFYEIRPTKLKITHLAVDIAFRRKGVGRAMISKLFSKLTEKRSKLFVFVSEYGLDLQLFLRDLGFTAVQIINGREGHSEYKFTYELKQLVIV